MTAGGGNTTMLLRLSERTRVDFWSVQYGHFLARRGIILKQAMSVFGQYSIAQRWLIEPALGLGHVTPCVLLSTPTGFEAVHDYLVRLQYGVYT
ncbi:antitoxin Xre/MbcA/ParS toxin-binding domain-containing protein [Pseudomonas rubra]|uniref:antitoxin Xre/MbcA/ParS toxin-binding domain-containing protein n=2 Tax=Pseudomonas rubra TaxID=2942627 RepID=UPI003B66FC36